MDNSASIDIAASNPVRKMETRAPLARESWRRFMLAATVTIESSVMSFALQLQRKELKQTTCHAVVSELSFVCWALKSPHKALGKGNDCCCPKRNKVQRRMLRFCGEVDSYQIYWTVNHV
jgi:hypothetical protein